MQHPIAWHAPSPLWSRILDAPAAAPVGFRQPALLRFAGDSFMDELGKLLAASPAALADHVARPETWRRPAVGWTAAASGPLKLYQAAHGRFYLVAASLVCRLAGLPDRKVDAAAEERVAFLVRRLAPASAGGAVNPADPRTWRELGWFGDRAAGTWNALADAAQADPREERLPLFPVAFADGDRRRRLHAGLIPVAGGETYAAGTTAPIPASELAGDPLGDPRAAELAEAVLPALRQLAELSAAVTDDEARELLLLALLDLADLLERRLAALWQAIAAGAAPAAIADADVYQRLGQTVGAVKTWRQLLATAAADAAAILAGDLGVAAGLTRAAIRQAAETLLGPAGPSSFAELLRAAFAARPLPPGGAVTPPSPAADGAFYVVRCVYERPRCAAVAAPAVSPPSAAFRLASYFDPDAPARPLRISMPVDTSPAGLRRFPKGVSVLLSSRLRRQLERATSVKLGDLDDGNAGADPGNELGVICSLSIPIISICALILLMILVNLLNIVFWWKPFFKLCFPLKLKAK